MKTESPNLQTQTGKGYLCSWGGGGGFWLHHEIQRVCAKGVGGAEALGYSMRYMRVCERGVSGGSGLHHEIHAVDAEEVRAVLLLRGAEGGSWQPLAGIDGPKTANPMLRISRR